MNQVKQQSQLQTVFRVNLPRTDQSSVEVAEGKALAYH